MRSLAYTLSLSMLLALGWGCDKTEVGRQCILPGTGDAGPGETVVGSPALECESRTCVHVAGTSPDQCTAECGSDDDCHGSSLTPCRTGFVCAVPVVVGAFCCTKYCICKDYNPSTVVPAACDPADTRNECCNLEGRPGDPRYPQCK
jgi:hypothetical protein